MLTSQWWPKIRLKWILYPIIQLGIYRTVNLLLLPTSILTTLTFTTSTTSPTSTTSLIWSIPSCAFSSQDSDPSLKSLSQPGFLDKDWMPVSVCSPPTVKETLHSFLPVLLLSARFSLKFKPHFQLSLVIQMKFLKYQKTNTLYSVNFKKNRSSIKI